MLIAAPFTIAKRWKEPKCPSMGEWINKCGTYNGILFSHKKEWSIYTCYKAGEPRKYYWVGQKVRSDFSYEAMENPERTFWPTQYVKWKKARHKRSLTVWGHWYEMSRIVKFTETESRLVVARGWEEEGLESNCLMGRGFLLREWKCFASRRRWWLYDIVTVVNATELFTSKWLYVNLTSVFF